MRRLVLIILLLLTVIFCPAQTGKSIKVVEFIHPPFVYQDTQSNELKGAEIEYITAILKDMGYEPTFIPVPFPRMLYMLESGDADVGPFLTKTAERENFAYYSSKPVLIMNPVLVVRKESPLKHIKSPSDLKNYKIGFAVGQTVPPFFNNSDLPPFDLATGDNLTEQNLKKLIGKRFDACIMLNPFNARFIAKNMNITDSIRTVDIPGSETMFYWIVSKKSGISANILKEINARMSSKKFDFEKYLEKELK